MQQTFKHYLTLNESMDFEMMTSIHQEILTQADIQDEDFQWLWQDCVHYAIEYSRIRSQWHFLSMEEKQSQDASRTSLHNNLIGCFLSLERLFEQSGWQSERWTEQLFLQQKIEKRTKEDVQSHRQRIGDFSNYLAFVYALNSR
ncbi:hypothetical protein [Enterococcus cecorum]|uniref:hypothetical protein n=1 Tax=Enterococcus cecorum TaxID=44008 RepID=UPI00200A25CD|nr:hypothetical protein [Enterococcus cecorum]